jgi:phage gp46-like protein
MTDLKIIDIGNGGDAVLQGNDFVTIDGFQTMVYLALFGGNVQSSTIGERPENEQQFDWWGNRLLFNDNQKIMFNSQTEKLLNEIALNSSSRVKVEQTVRSDLSFMNDFADVSVRAAITDVNRIEILIKISQPNNQQDKEFIYIWDATKKELIQ